MTRCPKCGRFLSRVVAFFNGLDDILKVTGECKRHGTVEPEDWDADMFDTDGL